MSKPMYRTLFEAFWTSKEWRGLAPGPASSQALIMYLSVGPLQRAVPGVLLVGEGELADRLRWSPKDVRKCVDELVTLGALQVDRDACLMWLPWRYEHEPVQNVNQVKGWRRAFEQWPAGQLAQQVRDELRRRLEMKGDLYLKAFDALPDGSVEGLGERVTPNGSGEGLPPTVGGNQRSSEAVTQGNSEKAAAAACDQGKYRVSQSEGDADDWPAELVQDACARAGIPESAWGTAVAGKVSALPRDQRIRAALAFLDKPRGQKIGVGLLVTMIQAGDGANRAIPERFIVRDRRPSWEREGFSSPEEREAVAAERSAEILRSRS